MQAMLSRESRHRVPVTGQPGPVPGPALSAQSGFPSLSEAKVAGGSLILNRVATSCQQPKRSLRLWNPIAGGAVRGGQAMRARGRAARPRARARPVLAERLPLTQRGQRSRRRPHFEWSGRESAPPAALL